MAYYPKLKHFLPERRNHVIDKLLQLKDQLKDQIPVKDLEEHLMLATWNIRDFGKKGGFNPQERLPESYFYIAEILSSFDLIAVQEVNDLEPLERVLGIMGSHYSYIATDVSDRSAGGNGERMTFIYDKRKISFKNIAGEIVLPTELLISKAELQIDGGKVIAGKQFRRTPYLVSFQCGWFKFDLCTVHIYYGDEKKEDEIQERIEEIQAVANYLSKRADESFLEHKSLILLGDFNIVDQDHETMKALINSGFVVPEKLKSPTNLGQVKRYYDQIAFKTTKGHLEFIDAEATKGEKGNAGVFDIFQSCFNGDDFIVYRDQLITTGEGKNIENDEEKLKKYYHKWKTWQLSDHHLMWARLKINDSISYINNCRIK
ncbi:endonuclease/exonuclease/phosphatase family metal-dependent hydrolase [Chryseobacterium sp. H1D6B]|uniref:endonuclease/exonuclease/phosphatase family protein n=1 Tax=Chryseobacterium sp. H1D6B TaxID=2940588 RepID=UPI0015CB062E|nr:endonuclease/exonuclease/phosphatase family protein [Chryseobacterium sp. H1D6B]MDH6252502.1 endonuclease/exonuclease/phosphatase family metal-dependent hydrolase [Chryseobacterium sp. H1D6B]